MTTPGDRVANARMARGLTQRELGAEMGVTGPTVAAYERATDRAEIGTMVRLAEKLAVRSAWLAFGEPPVKGDEYAEAVGALVRAVNEFLSKEGISQAKAMRLALMDVLQLERRDREQAVKRERDTRPLNLEGYDWADKEESNE
jgi:transcriptional regulator with XRE-family HTH domain